MKMPIIVQKACCFASLFGASIYPSPALTVESSIANHFKSILVAQAQVPTSWEIPRFSVKKTTIYNDRIEWIVEDMCQGTTCLTGPTSVAHAQYQDSDGITIDTALIFWEGTGYGSGSRFRAIAQKPSSASWSKVKKVVVVGLN